MNKTLIHDLVHGHQIVVIGNDGRLTITPRRMSFVCSDWIDWNMKYSAFRAEYYNRIKGCMSYQEKCNPIARTNVHVYNTTDHFKLHISLYCNFTFMLNSLVRTQWIDRSGVDIKVTWLGLRKHHVLA